VESKPGEGAVFTVYLPWSSQAARKEDSSAEAPLGSGETILLVDDEEALVHLGEEMLASLGYEPVGFTSSSAAFAAFRENPDRFEAVISDEAMADLSGSELAKAVRELRPDLPVILMSGYVSPLFAARARNIGVAEVLAKPLVARDIARALANALRSRHAA
jgi:DNA-binding NtrC family response regulator